MQPDETTLSKVVANAPTFRLPLSVSRPLAYAPEAWRKTNGKECSGEKKRLFLRRVSSLGHPSINPERMQERGGEGGRALRNPRICHVAQPVRGFRGGHACVKTKLAITVADYPMQAGLLIRRFLMGASNPMVGAVPSRVRSPHEELDIPPPKHASEQVCPRNPTNDCMRY